MIHFNFSVRLMKVHSIILLIGSIMACSNGSFPKHTPASVQVQHVSTEIAQAKSDLVKTQGVVKDMNAGNVEATKPVASTLVESAIVHIDYAQTGATQAIHTAIQTEDTVKKQDAEIVKLKANDPVKNWLNLIGVSLIAGSILALIASVLVSTVSVLPWVRSGAIAGVVAGLCFVTIAHFLSVIYWMAGLVLITLAVAGLVWVVTHKAVVATKVRDFEKGLGI